MVVLSLIACSEDSYQEADKMNETEPVNNDSGGMQTNSFENDTPGTYIPGNYFVWQDPTNSGAWPYTNTPGEGYITPWDIWYRNKYATPSYIITTGSETSDFYLRVIPWVGLAYYDSANDGRYHDPFIASTSPPGLIADMAANPTLYPNLYANSNEIGNLVPAQPIIMDGSSLQNCEVAINSTRDHLPVDVATLGSGWNPINRFFNLSGGVTSQERNLLRNYGKVFFYQVEVYNRYTMAPLASGFLQLENANLHNTGTGNVHWTTTSVTGTAPGMGAAIDLYYYYANIGGTIFDPTQLIGSTVNQCDSLEVVFENIYPSSIGLAGPSGKRIYFQTVQGVPYLWGNGGVALSIR